MGRLIIFESAEFKLSKLNEGGNKVDVSLVKSYLNSRKLNLFAGEIN